MKHLLYSSENGLGIIQKLDHRANYLNLLEINTLGNGLHYLSAK